MEDYEVLGYALAIFPTVVMAAGYYIRKCNKRKRELLNEYTELNGIYPGNIHDRSRLEEQVKFQKKLRI